MWEGTLGGRVVDEIRAYLVFIRDYWTDGRVDRFLVNGNGESFPRRLGYSFSAAIEPLNFLL